MVIDKYRIFLLKSIQYIYQAKVTCDIIEDKLKQSQNDGQYVKYLQDGAKEKCQGFDKYPPTFDDFKSLVVTTISNEVTEGSADFTEIIENGLGESI